MAAQLRGSSPSRPAPRPRQAVAVLTLALALILAACETGASGGQGGSTTSLTIATTYEITDLDPAASGYWAPEFGYGELLMRAHDDGTLEPWLLESLEPVAPTTWRLTLREGITFQNGRTLDATALSALLNHHLTTNEDLQAVVPGGEATPVSELEVELTTSRPAGTVPAAFAHELMVPVFDLEAAEQAGDDVAAQIAAKYWTGPFVVTAITSEDLTMERNPDYWGGTPRLEEVTVRFISDAQARVLAVQSGEADLALYPDSAAAQVLEGSDEAAFITSEVPHSSVRMILNQEDPVLGEEDVRRAISLAVDYDELAEQVLPVVFDVGTGMYPAHLPFAEQVQRSDLDEAEALLDAAGWTRGSGEVRERDGRRLRLSFVVDDQIADLQAMTVALQGQLKELGVEVDINEVADVYEATEGDDWSAVFLMSNVYGADYVGDAQRFLASDGRLNLGHIDDAELDGLIAQALAETDGVAQADLLREIQQRVGERMYGVFPAERRSSVIASAAWRDYVVPMNNLWVDAETAASGS
ncbi:ABC transporter substrate-binding protein [Nocardioides sp. L-11A]|uniref:ABC transporter substrate-binding protein n=1 Tax=Nocardioides sp. L-11A TaxID=3043848 RepID=UPI00249B5777|nr:ABC transporter substrate-binding protein [Nocardioides sp. L-11A]